MNILITGGLGFIGSHTTIELLNNNHDVIIVDNLVNSKIETLHKLQKIIGIRPVFYKIDVANETQLSEVFTKHKIDGAIHLAGLKAVGESVMKPLDYYYNNLVSTMTLSKVCQKYNVKRLVFSSSATVYGDQSPPLKEGMELKRATNPYGETKRMSEQILTDIINASPGSGVSLLRYFNPVGAHKSGLIGEDPIGIPNNLMPYITRVAKGKYKKLMIFGNDYETVDGTGVRDYIHVVDLAKGHVKAVEKMREGVNVYNLGTGQGTSVLELVSTFIKVNNINIPYEVVGRRQGDVAICYADASLAQRELGWKAELDLDDMVRDAWNYEKNVN